MRLYGCFLGIVASVFLVTWIYIISYHRISTPKEMVDLLYLSTRNTVANGRCKVLNGSHAQCLANVYFIGASKAGTTTMMELLSLHPEVHFTQRRVPPTWYNNDLTRRHGQPGQLHREIHRFDRRTYDFANSFVELLDEYSCSPVFPLGDVDEASAGPTVIHYTPHYLYAPSVPFDLHSMYSGITGERERRPLNRRDGSNVHVQQPARRLVDELVFVVMLREPIARALSSYWFKQSHLFGRVDAAGTTQDAGSLDEFQDEVLPAELTWRHRHDACMRRRYYGQFASPLDVINRRASDTGTGTGTGAASDADYFAALEACFSLEIEADARPHPRPEMSADGKNASVEGDGDGPVSESSFRGRVLGLHHINKGVYHDQLLRWFRLFPPLSLSGAAGGDAASGGGGVEGGGRNRYCLVYLEQFSAAPVREYSRLLTCIGRDPTSPASAQALRLLEARAGADKEASDAGTRGQSLHRLRSPNALATEGSDGECGRAITFSLTKPAGSVVEPPTSVSHSSYNEFYSAALSSLSRSCRSTQRVSIFRRLVQFYRPHNDRLSRLLEGVGL